MADAKYSEDNRPYDCFRVLIEENEETTCNSSQYPASPDSPAKATKARCQERDEDASGEKKTSNGEDVQTGLCRRGETDGCEVERDIVEGTEELDQISAIV